jgi:hypothetical protein
MEKFLAMYIHIGNNILISDHKCVGIFNIETLKLSDDNRWMLDKININDKMISLDIDNNKVASEVSSFTIMKRITIKEDELFWSRK